jgi:hypothetical protein
MPPQSGETGDEMQSEALRLAVGQLAQDRADKPMAHLLARRQHIGRRLGMPVLTRRRVAPHELLRWGHRSWRAAPAPSKRMPHTRQGARAHLARQQGWSSRRRGKLRRTAASRAAQRVQPNFRRGTQEPEAQVLTALRPTQAARHADKDLLRQSAGTLLLARQAD